MCFETAAWRALTLVEELPHEQVKAILTYWPSDVAIRVRRCDCGNILSRKEPR